VRNLADADVSAYLAAITAGKVLTINQPGTANTMTFNVTGPPVLTTAAVSYYSIPVSGGAGVEPTAVLVTLFVS
jgi:hypothetical protein